MLTMLEEAKECGRCKDCLPWLKYCNAECCRVIRISVKHIPKKWKGNILRLRTSLTPDQIWYFRLHGCHYRSGVLTVFTKNSEIKGEHIYVYRDCDLLENNLCTGHPNDKPMICRALEPENIPEDAFLTDNCYMKLLEENKK